MSFQGTKPAALVVDSVSSALQAKDKRSHSSGDLRETLLPSPTGGAATDGVASSEFKAIFDKIQGQRKVNPGLMRDLSTIAEEKDSIR